jgi:hypothetical protein
MAVLEIEELEDGLDDVYEALPEKENIKRDTKTLTVEKLFQMYADDELDLHPPYQRESGLWSRSKKEGLIDTIIRNYDMPKIYLRRPDVIRVGGGKDEVLDGQQRLSTVFALKEGNLTYKGKYWADLPTAIQKRINNYKIDVTIMKMTEEQARTQFAKLQEGLSLNGQEKRNAAGGQLNDKIKALAMSEFFPKTAIRKRRFAYTKATLVLVHLAFSDYEPVSTSDDQLTKFNNKYKDGVDPKVQRALKQVKTILATFDQMFSEEQRLPAFGMVEMMTFGLIIGKWLFKDKITLTEAKLKETAMKINTFLAEVQESGKDKDDEDESLAVQDDSPKIKEYHSLKRATTDSSQLRKRVRFLETKVLK